MFIFVGVGIFELSKGKRWILLFCFRSHIRAIWTGTNLTSSREINPKFVLLISLVSRTDTFLKKRNLWINCVSWLALHYHCSIWLILLMSYRWNILLFNSWELCQCHLFNHWHYLSLLITSCWYLSMVGLVLFSLSWS